MVKISDVKILESDKDKFRSFLETRKNSMFESTPAGRYSIYKNQLLVPSDLAIELTRHCGLCGEPLKGKTPTIYFGEYFCLLCVQKAVTK